jgi:hypothetical protein
VLYKGVAGYSRNIPLANAKRPEEI